MLEHSRPVKGAVGNVAASPPGRGARVTASVVTGASGGARRDRRWRNTVEPRQGARSDAKPKTTLMAWLRRLLTADPSPLAGGSALSGPVGLLAVEEEERRDAA